MTDPAPVHAPVHAPVRSFRKKPVTVEAFRLGERWPEWWAAAVSANRIRTHNTDERWRGGPDYAMIATMHGTVRAEKGDWIIRDALGDLYALRDATFRSAYEEVSA